MTNKHSAAAMEVKKNPRAGGILRFIKVLVSPVGFWLWRDPGGRGTIVPRSPHLVLGASGVASPLPPPPPKINGPQGALWVRLTPKM